MKHSSQRLGMSHIAIEVAARAVLRASEYSDALKDISELLGLPAESTPDQVVSAVRDAVEGWAEFFRNNALCGLRERMAHDAEVGAVMSWIDAAHRTTEAKPSYETA